MLYDGVERRIRRVEVIGASTNGEVDNAARKGAFWTDDDLRGLEKDLLLGSASDIDDLQLVYELLPCSFCNAKSAPYVLGLFVNGSETTNGQLSRFKLSISWLHRLYGSSGGAKNYS
jgi:hypothetical protein